MNIFSKLRDFVGISNEPEYDDVYDETEGERYQNFYQAPEPNPAAVAAAEEERRQNRRMRERSVV